MLILIFLGGCAREEPITIEVLDPDYFDKLLSLTEIAVKSNESCVFRYDALALKNQKHMLLYHGVIGDEGH